MVARRVDEPDRVSTPLELLFDLCFVVSPAPIHVAAVLLAGLVVATVRNARRSGSLGGIGL
jgi:hypothetical protein